MKNNVGPCDVSIIIVSFNTRELTLACLRSVYAEAREASFEVIVLDNASSDGSAAAIGDQFPQVKLLISKSNLGFAGANNLAAAEALGNYVLLLNPDTVVLDQAIERLLHFAQAEPGYGIYGGRTVFSNGSLNASSCFRRPTVWNSFCRSLGISAIAKNSAVFSADVYGAWNRDTVREVDIVTGCFLMMKRSLWETLGGLDTSYFMYGEDWDLCLRAREMSVKCVHCPAAEIVHYGGASEPVRADRMVRLFQTRVLLYYSHWKKSYARLLELSLWAWAFRCLVVDGVFGALGNSARQESSKTWSEVLRRHREWRRASALVSARSEMT